MVEIILPRSSSSSSSRSSSFSRSPSRSTFRPSSPLPKPKPSVPTPTTTVPTSNINVSPSLGIMDGIKWGFGTSVGHSIGNLFGFGTQHVHHDNAPPASANQPSIALPKDEFTTCLETIPHEQKLQYCQVYSACLHEKSKYYDNNTTKDLCREKALNSLSNSSQMM